MAGNMVLGETKMRPPVAGDGGITLTLTRRDDIITAESAVDSISNDANIRTSVTATTDTAWDIEASGFHFNRPVSVALSCSATGAINGNRLTRVSDGSCQVLAKSGAFIQSQTVSMLRSVSVTSTQWLSWIDGTLAATLEHDTAMELPFWSGGEGGYAMGSGYGFTAISPRHVIGVEHVEWMPPQLMLGGVVRNLVSQAVVGPSNGEDLYVSDLRVGLYDGDFPHFAKVLPSTLINHLPNYALRGFNMVITNQDKLQIARRSLVVRPGLFSCVKLNASDIDIRGGDSGNPGFLVINGEPILIGPLQQGGAGGVVTIHDQAALVNAAMTSLGGGYQLTVYDLSEYPTY